MKDEIQKGQKKRINFMIILFLAVLLIALLASGLLFNSGYTLAAWIVTGIIYVMSVLLAVFVVKGGGKLFAPLESEEEKERENPLENIRGTFEELKESAEKINDALANFEERVIEVSGLTAVISESANTQIGQVESSLTILSDLSGKITNSEEQVSRTVDNINLLKEKNDEGIVAIEELSRKFEENIESTKVAAEGVTSLAQKSSSIGDIIESIGQIAKQTNLLALNAAIEAARAGEAGRGFAVVADEINSLSNESSAATQKINAILKDVIATVEKTNEVIDCNNVIVKESHTKLNDTIQIFKSMLHASEEVTAVTEVLKEELAGIVLLKEHLLEEMEKVREVSRESVQNTIQINNATIGQAEGAENIFTSMESVQGIIDKLSEELNYDEEAEEQKEIAGEA